MGSPLYLRNLYFEIMCLTIAGPVYECEMESILHRNTASKVVIVVAISAGPTTAIGAGLPYWLR